MSPIRMIPCPRCKGGKKRNPGDSYEEMGTRTYGCSRCHDFGEVPIGPTYLDRARRWYTDNWPLLYRAQEADAERRIYSLAAEFEAVARETEGS